MLLPLITFAVGSTFVEVDYNVQMSLPKPAAIVVPQQSRPSAQRDVQGGASRTPLNIGGGSRATQGIQFAAPTRSTLGLQFASPRTTLGLQFQSLRPVLYQFAAEGSRYSRLNIGGPWPERMSLPWIPGGLHTMMYSATGGVHRLLDTIGGTHTRH